MASGDRPTVSESDRVRLLYVAGTPRIGDLRNIGCDNARGEVIAHWDDDDYSAPERLADQIARLTESGKAVTGYHSMRFTDGARWWKYGGSPDYALGTSLCYRRDWWARNTFVSMQIGEDNAFVSAARTAGEIVSADAGKLMYATVHQSNTSPRNLKGSNWKQL